MNVTRNVINDLLPAYLSREASADTQALVDEYARQDPEFSRLIEQRKKQEISQTNLLKGNDVTLSGDLEVKTLARTKAMLARQSWFLALALMFTGFPFSFIFDKDHLSWLMLRDRPAMASLCWAIGLGFWIARFVTNRRLQTTAPRSIGTT